jgi:hypothetical protein
MPFYSTLWPIDSRHCYKPPVLAPIGRFWRRFKEASIGPLILERSINSVEEACLLRMFARGYNLAIRKGNQIKFDYKHYFEG